MITNFELHDFKGHRDTRLTLGRFTALVGDNASGKTSVLEAIELPGMLWPNVFDVLRNARAPIDLVRRGSQGLRLVADGDSQVELSIDVGPRSPPGQFSLNLKGNDGSHGFEARANSREGVVGEWENIHLHVAPAMLYRLNARDVAAVAPIADPRVQVDSTGANTGAVLAALKLTDDGQFERIVETMRRLVPTVEHVRLKQERIADQVSNRILFDFRGARNVPAHGASQGTLVLLALLTVLHGPGRPDLVLLDDFEHTLHPRAQMEVVRLIKSLLALEEFAHVQVVATTHSPYVLDEMDVADVRAFAIGDDGCVRTKPLSAHPEAERSKGTLTAGQLWSLDPERAWVLKE